MTRTSPPATVTIEVKGRRASYPWHVVAQWPKTMVNGRVYLCPTGQDFIVTHTPDGTSFRTSPPMMDAVNRCDCCGRADYAERIIGSLDEAVEAGLLVPCPEELR